MKNFTIGTQLRLGLGLLLLLLLALGFMARWQAEQQWQQTVHLYGTSLEVRDAIGTLQTGIQVVRGEFRSYILAQSEADRNAARQAIETAIGGIERQFDILYGRYKGPRADIDQARDAFSRWRALHVENREWVRAGRNDEALARTGPTGDIGALRKELLERIEVISEFSRRRAAQAFEDAGVQKNSLLRLTVTVAAVAVAFAVFVFWALMRHIRQPLRELTDVVGRFRRGEREVRSGYVSGSEIGVLAHAVDEMIETINAQAHIDGQVTQLTGAMLRETEAGDFCRALLQGLIEHTGSQVGAIYLLDPARGYFEHFESIGLADAAPAGFLATTTRGEFGAALASGRMQRITDIPHDTPFVFVAASGTFRPREIITIPLRSGGDTVAVISLASVRTYAPAAIHLLEAVVGTAAARTSGVLAYREIQQLAAQLELRNAELQAQKEELQQQHEELVAQGEELRQQAEELQEQNIELERQRLAVEEANRLKGAFLSNMSHELRTPLNSVLVLSGLLRKQTGDKLTEEQRGYLDIMERNGRSLLNLINEILDLAKIEAGRMVLQPHLFPLRITLETLVANLAPLASAKNVGLRLDLPADLPSLESDEARVTQILQNLVGNAIKFTDQGGVTISVRSDGRNISIQVADTGIGIPPEALSAIFDEFRQVDGSTTRRHDGTGLGLAIARKTARLLGGDVTVVSTPGMGSTFTLSLPVTWSPDLAAGERAEVAAPAITRGAPSQRPDTQREPTDGGPAPAGGVRRILLVEDNEVAILQVKAVLEGAGYVVDVARGGQQACDYVAGTVPDAVVLDLMMPGVDGFAVLEKIRGTPATATLPVLILTAKDLGPEDFRRLRANHVQQLVLKGDVDREQLLARMAKLVETTPSVLIVEDHPDNLATLRATLRTVLQGSCRILEATDGEAALRVVAEARPDLVLLDLGLPKLDGFAVVRVLKRDPLLRHIPVIAVTAQAMKGDRERILAAGCEDYIPKPIDPEALRGAVERWLRRARTTHA